MKATGRYIEFDTPHVSIRPLFDMHIGARACDENKLDRDIKTILNTPHCYTLIGGDMADAILRQDLKRYLPGCNNDEIESELDNALNVVTKQIIKKLRPLAEAGKILAFIDGNHEYEVKKRHAYSITEAVADMLDVPFLGYSGFINLGLKQANRGPKYKCVIYIHHGFGGGKKKGSSINNLIDLAAHYKADVYVMGHDHKRIATRESHFEVSDSVNNPRILQKERVFARAGTYLKTFLMDGKTTYSEKAGYPPVPTGSIEIRISVKRENGANRGLERLEYQVIE